MFTWKKLSQKLCIIDFLCIFASLLFLGVLAHLANLFYLIILYISFVYKKSFSLMLKQCWNNGVFMEKPWNDARLILLVWNRHLFWSLCHIPFLFFFSHPRLWDTCSLYLWMSFVIPHTLKKRIICSTPNIRSMI